MEGTYDLELVTLSILVAIIASYTALELAGRVNQRSGPSSWAWLAGGSVSMGIGIWSMHFIGMLAFRLPIPMVYDPSLTFLSLLIAIIVSGFALLVVKGPKYTRRNISIGGTLMGFGISTMHYTGMLAIEMMPPITYDPLIFITSVLIAIVAASAALWLAFKFRSRENSTASIAKIGSAIVMGLGISGMHYTGMAAAQFSPDMLGIGIETSSLMDQNTLAHTVGVVTVGIMLVTLIISIIDAQFATRNARLAESLRAANEQLRNIALYDSLTGVPNRLLLEDRMSLAVSSAERNKNMFAVLFVDLDNFKPVNDAYGHKTGDEMLKAVAQRLRENIRGMDTIARTGGDEFIMLLCGINDSNDVEVVSRKMLSSLSQPFQVGQNTISISISIGISLYPKDGKDLDVLKENADLAMYHSKKSGRNGFAFFDPQMRLD